ncbi:cobalamin biosynthesis protein [Pseudaquabacterium rugosum]|uniref:Cobalamin biosynthesis protein n=1 Tax=Pseudaquabacterium rugosum TaxID=2984194 RepID=A0ABU9BEB9_9BURK
MRVAGLGFRQGAEMASLEAALKAALEAALKAALKAELEIAQKAARQTASAGAGAAPLRLDALATAARKAADPAAQALARRLGLPLLALSDEVLAAQTTLTESPRVRAHTGTGSLAEAAALAAAGPQGRLLGPRAVSPDGCATAAIAAGPVTMATTTATTATTATTTTAPPVTADPGCTAGAPAGSLTPPPTLAPAIPSLPENP